MLKIAYLVKVVNLPSLIDDFSAFVETVTNAETKERENIIPFLSTAYEEPARDVNGAQTEYSRKPGNTSR